MTKEERDLMTMALDALVDWNHSFNPGEEADKDLIAALEKCLENDAVDSEPVTYARNGTAGFLEGEQPTGFFFQADKRQPEPWEKFCDSNCVWTDHHPDCKLAEQPAQQWTDETAKVPDHVWDEECVIGHCGWPSGCADSERCRADNTPAQQQEPVAWKTDDVELYVREDKFGFYNIPLYTHPPQRTWVGLTEKDILEAAVKSQEGISPRNDTLRFAVAIEAKLKEKNT